MSFKKRYNKRIESNMHAHAETADPISVFLLKNMQYNILTEKTCRHNNQKGKGGCHGF